MQNAASVQAGFAQLAGLAQAAVAAGVQAPPEAVARPGFIEFLRTTPSAQRRRLVKETVAWLQAKPRRDDPELEGEMARRIAAIADTFKVEGTAEQKTQWALNRVQRALGK